MAREGIQNCDENYLRTITLPEKTDTYTVISHGYIIDKVRNTLRKNNLEIENEEYLYSYGGNVALCKVKIKSTKDPDLGMLFTWWNSYNKMVKFGCAIGGFIYDNNTSLIGSEGMSWIRKHTGTADEESSNIIEQLIAQADIFFDKIIAEKERMKAMPLDTETFGCIMGALYFELDLISPNQASAIKQEYKKPENEYKDKDTLWGLYKLLMFGIDGMDLRKWAVNQQKLHYTIMTTYATAEHDPELVTAVNDFAAGQLEGIKLPIAPVEVDQIVDEVTPTIEVESLILTKEEVAYNLINEHGKDPAIVNYFCDVHFQNNLTLEQNVEAFFNYIKPNVDEFTAAQLSGVKAPSIPEEIKEALMNAPEVEVENTETFVFPDDLDNTEKLNASIESETTVDVTIDELETITETVETSTIPAGFEWLLEDDVADAPEHIEEGLIVPDEVKELAVKIEAKMKELYGQINPYTYKETEEYCIVTISNTNEVFFV